MEVTDAHRAYMDDLKAALSRHPNLTPVEMLAITSQLVGNMVALQDQRTMTPARAMEIVAGNIEIGNQVACDDLLHSAGSA